MTIPRVWPLGVNNLDVLEGADVTQLDVNISRAVDGQGGHYPGPLTIDALGLTGTARLTLAARSLTRVLRAGWRSQSTQWAFADGQLKFFQSVGTGGGSAVQAIEVPDGATITGLTAYYTPPSGHSGAIGTLVLPQIFFGKMDTAGTATSIANAHDTSGSFAAYETRHALALTGLTEVVNNATTKYWIEFIPETGANALQHLELELATVTFTTSSYDDGAS